MLSFFSLLYSAIKTVFEVKTWVPLSDSEKRQKIFGDMYNFIVFIDAHTEKNAHILIFSKDGKIGLITKYYSYPRIVNPTTDKKKFIDLVQIRAYDYVSIYNSVVVIRNYDKIASYSSKTSSDFGVLYKRR